MQDRHILGLSGGKDSAALAIFMKQERPEMDVEYFFTDTGHELPEVYAFLDKLESVLQIPIERLKPDIGETNGKRNEAFAEGSSEQLTPFKYWFIQNNHFLPSFQSRWCTVNMKLRPFEKWIQSTLEEGGAVTSYIAIRADENREGYKPVNENIKVQFPFVEAGIDKQGVINLLEKSGVGLPDYYKWRSRSGCTFCFYQQKIEWVRLKENHPVRYEEAKKYEQDSINHPSSSYRFTWSEGETLNDLEQPVRVEQINKDYAKRKQKWKDSKKQRDPLSWAKETRHYAAEEEIDEIYGDQIGHACIICHK